MGWGILLAVILLMLLFRLPFLDRQGLHGDEDISTIVARGIAETGEPQLPSGHLYLRAPLYHYVIAPLAATHTDWLPRLVSIFFSVLGGVAVLRLGRPWVGAWSAVAGAVIFAVVWEEVMLGRYVRMYSLYSLLAMLAMFAVYRLWESGKHRDLWIASALVLLSMGAHQLGGTLCVLFIPVLVRWSSWRMRLSVLVSATVLIAVAKWHQAWNRSAFMGGHENAVEPVPDIAEKVASQPIQDTLSQDPWALSTMLIGDIGPYALGVVFAVVFAVVAISATRGRPWLTRLLGMLGLAFALAAAGVHQVGVAVAAMVILILHKDELFPGPTGSRALAIGLVTVMIAGIVWVVAAKSMGCGLRDSVEIILRWPARYLSYLLDALPVGIAACAGAVAITVRAWRGNATFGERFLLLAVILLLLTRGLLTWKTQARFLVEIWPLWGLLAGWSVVRGLDWLNQLVSRGGPRTAPMPIAVTALAAIAFLMGGVLQKSTAYVTRETGEDWWTPGTRVAWDIESAVEWLRPRLEPGDRVVATDWLMTYAYLERVDAWTRWRGWGRQAYVDSLGTIRDIYLSAELIPTLDDFLAYCEKWPVVWVFAKGSHLKSESEKMDPSLQSLLSDRPADFVSPDGATSIYRFTWEDAGLTAERP